MLLRPKKFILQFRAILKTASLILFRFLLYWGLFRLVQMLLNKSDHAGFYKGFFGQGIWPNLIIAIGFLILATLIETYIKLRKIKPVFNLLIISGAIFFLLLASEFSYLLKYFGFYNFSGQAATFGAILSDSPWFYQATFTLLVLSFALWEAFSEVDFERLAKIKYLDWIIFIFGVLIYSILSINRHRLFGSFTMDLGGYDQAIWLLSRFQTPASSIYHYPNLLGDHFEPLLAIISPVYWFAKSVNIILFLQAVAVSLPVFPIFALSKKYLKSNFAAALISLSYLLFIGIQDAMEFDFHPLVFVPAALAYAFYFFDQKKYLGYFISLVAGLLMKEVVSLYVIFFGIYALVRKKWSIGLVTIGLGVFWYVLAIHFIIPHLSGKPYGHIGAYHALGSDAAEIIKTIITQPLYTINIMLTPGSKIQSALALFGSGGFLTLLSPSSLLLAIPMIGEKYLATDRESNWAMWWHYSATIAIPIYLGAIFGIKNLTNWVKSRRVDLVVIGAIFVFLMTTFIAFSYYNHPPFPAPLAKIFTREFYRRDEHLSKVEDVISKIDQKASVATQNSILPHLSHRKEIYFINSESIPPADYIVLDENINHWPIDDDVFAGMIKKMKDDPKYKLIVQEDTLYVFQKNS
jgi:uncharacterized membrane protein